MTRFGIAALLVAGVLAAPTPAEAFCGFYIDPGGNQMFNNATQVVLMRQGTRTVLSMQNNYQGPPGDFAMVIPVPVVLKEADVKTLSKDIFKKVDQMGSPRLVEYWEQDPCAVDSEDDEDRPRRRMESAKSSKKSADDSGDYGVTVEAKFEVGEYQIVILSAKDSTGLDRWLRSEKYQIPKGAEPLLKPYVASGSKFFVAKVNPAKVRFENGMAQLSPLRFHYDTEEFSLPIRLGLANSNGTQDLIVNILAPGQRFELANYKNVFIPTNFDVKNDVRSRFGEFYAALFDRTVQQNPGAVVTEYSWDAATCDPCPGPVLDYNDFMTLGADVIGGGQGDEERPRMRRGRRGGGGAYVLTRLHARYGKEVPNDLVFKAAPPVVGGREQRGANHELEHGAIASSYNNFQGRYAIRHGWTGAVACQNPQRGRWGGPPAGSQIAKKTEAATDIAFAPRGKMQLPMMVFKDIPEIGVQQGVALPLPPPSQLGPVPSTGVVQQKPQGCGCEAGAGGLATSAWLGLGVLALLRRKRTR